MLAIICFIVLLSSGSVFCTAKYQKRFELTIPVTLVLYVLIIFLCGLLGILNAGIWVVISVAVLLYILAGFYVIRDRSWHQTLCNLLTPGMLVFVVCVIIYSFLYRGKLAIHWDEFTHWMDAVKVMYQTGDFTSNPMAHCGHGSYPPGMAIIEFLLQELHGLLYSGAAFKEELAYIAYQTSMLCVMIPVMNRCSFRKPLSIIAYSLAIVLSPLLFFEDFFSNILVDPAIGILSGSGMVAIFLTADKDKDWLYHLYIMSLCCMLVLIKDAGLLFALFLAAAFLLDSISSFEDLRDKKKLAVAMAAISAILIPKLLWDFEIRTSGIDVHFGTSFDFNEVLQTFTGGREPYRMEVMKLYLTKFHEWTFPMGNTQIQISYVSLTMLLLFSICLVCVFFIRRNYKLDRGQAVVAIALSVQLFAYIIGLCVSYMFKFSQTEAENLASFSRYICIGFLPVWLLLVFSSLSLVRDLKSSCGQIQLLAWCCALMMLIPTKPFISFVSRNDVSTSISNRHIYTQLSQAIAEHCTGEETVYLVSQERSNLDVRIMKFQTRPAFIANGNGSIGKYIDGEASGLTMEEWQTQLQGYDYVALLYLNDYFYDTFSSMFENPQQIQENCVYRVDKQTGMLSLCE